MHPPSQIGANGSTKSTEFRSGRRLFWAGFRGFRYLRIAFLAISRLMDSPDLDDDDLALRRALQPVANRPAKPLGVRRRRENHVNIVLIE